MPTRKDSLVSERKFVCTFEGCRRAFTRQEHLQRHSQNHDGSDHTCERCRAHFKRRDLLDRHVSRHQQKDAEGGALMTRKRSWKDADGNIVSKRPTLNAGKESRHASWKQGNEERSPVLMSPPISGGASDSNVYFTAETEFETAEDSWMFLPDNMDLADDTLDTLHNGESFWDMPDKVQPDAALYEDTFNPDTASSFNMPFTTMNNYNWLFDINIAPANHFSMDNVDLCTFPSKELDPLKDMEDQNGLNGYFGTAGYLQDQDPESAIVSSAPLLLSLSGAGDGRSQEQQANHPLQTPVSEKAPEAPESSTSTRGSTSLSGSTPPSSKASAVATSTVGGSYNDTSKQGAIGAVIFPVLERPMALLHPNVSFPKLDGLARSQVLSLIETVRPMGPDGHYVTQDHPLLSLSALQTYSDLYFSRFNTAYPLIHQATFEPSKVETLLLVSILLLGATYCEKDAHQLAVCIHDVLRPQIFAHSSFSARPELWVLQTALLVECFGKSRAGQKQHDMSHLFHGLLINLIRRSECQTVRPETLEGGKGDLEDDWKAWVEAEQKKRLALLCFMWDTQHAVLFCQSLCMSAFELRSSLPCHQSLWEADSAEKWQKLRRAQKPPPLFLTVLKSYLTAQAPVTACDLNALSRVLLLHGLMSIAWDFDRRDQTSLGIVGNSVLGDWRFRIASAYDTWKNDFDVYTNSVMGTLESTAGQQQEALSEFAIYTTVNSALYHAAHVILFSDFLDIQIYAGARHILGRPVGRADYSRSQRVVKRWANEQASIASKAAWHAAHIVKDASESLRDFDAGGLFIHPWCLYLATITIWSFHHARPGPKRAVANSDEEDDEMIWYPQANMKDLISTMTSGVPEQLTTSNRGSRKANTAGLTAVVSKHLSKIRWAVVHDGMLVLKGLVPWRLINEEETV